MRSVSFRLFSASNSEVNKIFSNLFFTNFGQRCVMLEKGATEDEIEIGVGVTGEMKIIVLIHSLKEN